MTRQFAIITCALVAVATVAACQKKTAETPPAQQGTVTAKPTPPAVQPAPTGPSPVDGTWEIIAYYMSDLATMPESEAKTWVGRTLRFSATEAVSGNVTCSDPLYAEIPIPRDTLLGMDAAYPPGILMLLANYDPLMLINIKCNGEALNALGRLLIKIDDKHIVGPWDGVYFEMTRTPDS